MNENSENVEFRYADISKVRLTPYRMHTTKAHENPPIAGQIWFYLGEEKEHFNHKYKKEDEKLVILSQIFTYKYIFKER